METWLKTGTELLPENYDLATEVLAGLMVPTFWALVGLGAMWWADARWPDRSGREAAVRLGTALKPMAAQRGGQLWCVFGCGGDRDPTKRPLMAAVVEKNADRVVVTSDNPRGEKPENIISQILLGLSHDECVQVQSDRALAIAETVAAASPADVILVAGKGHEDYQEIAGTKHPFSDIAHARAALAARSAA